MIHNNLAAILAGEKELTVTKLAGKVNISRQYMGMIVNENRVPHPEVMFRIANALGLAFGDVWYHEDNHKGVPVDGS